MEIAKKNGGDSWPLWNHFVKRMFNICSLNMLNKFIATVLRSSYAVDVQNQIGYNCSPVYLLCESQDYLL